MIAPSPVMRSVGAACSPEASQAMKTILHIGAHRCATTTFQTYMHRNSDRLTAQGVGFWGPARTRAGLFSGLQTGRTLTGRPNRRARGLGRVRLNCVQRAQAGTTSLVVSDQNMLGTIGQNLRLGSLYAGAGERIARYAEAFGGGVSIVVVNIRALEWYWASMLGAGLIRGHAAPHAADLQRLATGGRSWRDVITDVSCAIGDVPLLVLPFEIFGSRPEAQLACMTGLTPPRDHARDWHKATPRLASLRDFAPELPPGAGRWQPFNVIQRTLLRETYADDLMWLRAGADGLAQLIDDRTHTMTGANPSEPEMTRGNRYDHTKRRLAHARRG